MYMDKLAALRHVKASVIVMEDGDTRAILVDGDKTRPSTTFARA